MTSRAQATAKQFVKNVRRGTIASLIERLANDYMPTHVVDHVEGLGTVLVSVFPDNEEWLEVYTPEDLRRQPADRYPTFAARATDGALYELGDEDRPTGQYLSAVAVAAAVVSFRQQQAV